MHLQGVWVQVSWAANKSFFGSLAPLPNDTRQFIETEAGCGAAKASNASEHLQPLRKKSL